MDPEASKVAGVSLCLYRSLICKPHPETADLGCPILLEETPLAFEMEGTARKRQRREAGPGGGGSSSTDEGKDEGELGAESSSGGSGSSNAGDRAAAALVASIEGPKNFRDLAYAGVTPGPGYLTASGKRPAGRHLPDRLVRHFPNFHRFDRFELDLRGHTQP